MTACPSPRKSAYADQAEADRAVTRHLDAFPECAGVHAYPCVAGDHHHVGHETHQASAACRRRPSRFALERLAYHYAR